jgi:hypothetical protein
MQVRRAQARDAPGIQALYQALVPGDGNIAVDAHRVEGLETDANNHLLVAEVMGQVCGSAFLTVCLDPMYGFQPYSSSRSDAHAFFSRLGFDGERKRGFVKYLNRRGHASQ